MKNISILLVEDDPVEISWLEKSLHQLSTETTHYQLTHVKTLEAALSQIESKTFHLILTALFLSDSQGLDTFIEIEKRASSPPIIIIGNHVSEETAHEAIHLGAQDYIPKGEFNTRLLERIIQNSIERQLLKESLKALSFTDELTKLYNRRGFVTLLEQQIALSARMKKGFYLFVIDLDQLKQINDTFGHSAGDRALISTANCLKASFRRHDILGRIGGDEFAVGAIHSTVGSSGYLKKRLLTTVSTYNSSTKEAFTLSLSIGIAYYDGRYETTLEELFQLADQALYQEKKLIT